MIEEAEVSLEITFKPGADEAFVRGVVRDLEHTVSQLCECSELGTDLCQLDTYRVDHKITEKEVHP